MSLAPFIPLSGFFVNFLFAIFVFSRDPRAPANRVYLLLAASIAIWNLGSYHLFIETDPQSALFWARFLFMGCIVGVVAFFHLAMIVAGFEVRWISWLYAFEMFLVATNFTPLFIRDVRYLGSSGWYSVPGPMFYVFNVPFTLMFGSIFVLWKRRRQLPPFQQRRLTPVIFGQAMLSVGGANDLLPISGITYYPFTDVPVYPWGSLAAVFYGVITAYSVLQHELLDINVNIGRYAAYVIRVAFLFSITLGLLLIASVVTDAFNATAFVAAMFVFLIGAIIASVLFPRLFSSEGIENIERRILGDRFQYHDRVRAFIQNLPWQQELTPLLDSLHLLLTRTIGVRAYELILQDQAARGFSRYRAYPEQPREQIAELKPSSNVCLFFETTEAEYLALSKEYTRGGGQPYESEAREELIRFDAEVCLPLLSDTQLFGLLVIGRKASDEPYTPTDLQLLVDLGKNLALIVNQMRLKEEVLRAQEFDLLGRMSRGMAHDLNNLLTPISTLLQLATEGYTKEAMDSELLAVASRNVRTVRAYIKEALFFSENLRPDLQITRLDAIVLQAVEAALSTRKKGVNVKAFTPDNVIVEMDDVLILRLLNNVISNAIDASEPGEEVQVHLDRLAKTEQSRDWFRIRVVDRGVGIPQENIDRVLRPYYTTKDRGDEGRGFGLGLAISRRIVALHGGQLSIDSRPRRGTTVQIDLPSRPLHGETFEQPGTIATRTAAA